MKVELHLHTTQYSACATDRPQDVMRELIDAGYGAVYLTEHDEVWSHWELAELQMSFPDIRIFPGMEIALGRDKSQHLLVLGTADRTYLQLPTAEDIILRARTEGHLTVLAHPFPAQGEDPAILAAMGIQNRTKSHLDMKALSDTISVKLLDTKKMRFVNAARRDDLLREQGYQLANCTQETRSAIGRQLGANYMLTGSLVEIEKSSGREVRVSKKQDVYYQLTLEITDLETGLIAVRKQKDRLRRASKPLIGW